VHAGDQLDLAEERRPEIEHLAGQAHGLVEVVSGNAEGDLQLVLRLDHANKRSACKSRCAGD
jgi:hypothetical protein